VFSFMTDELLAGTGDIILPGSDTLSGVIKRYASGGENKLHCHPTEDHSFYVLQGQATFRIGRDEQVVVANKYDGVYMPKGTYYWFESSSSEKLVMLRSGTEQGSDRLDAAGNVVKTQRTADAPRVPARDV
jgi:mannose-6-phosphate isomerase-like protein (cupin superfamily)